MIGFVSKIINYLSETVGYVKVEKNGDKTVADANAKVVGYFNKKDNLTIDANGIVYALGDGSHKFLKY